MKKFFLSAFCLMSALFAQAAEVNAPAEVSEENETFTEVELSLEDLLVDVDQYETVKANTTDVFTQLFAKGILVVVSARGDGDTDLDLYAYDPSGDLVASDTDSTDQCCISFTPQVTGKYKIKVKNYGNVYNRYRFKILQ